MTHSLLYLACPYSNHPAGVEVAFDRVTKEAARLCKAGIPVFSPLTQGHTLFTTGGLVWDAKEWLSFDLLFAECCFGLIVLMEPSWQESRGVQIEMEWFLDKGRPVFFRHCGQHLTGLLAVINERALVAAQSGLGHARKG